MDANSMQPDASSMEPDANDMQPDVNKVFDDNVIHLLGTLYCIASIFKFD
jgi:hypothetical protein